MLFYSNKITSNYKNVIKLNSFCLNSINKYIWNIRNNIRYVFFFILKKNIILKLLFLFKIIMNLLTNYYNLIKVKEYSFNIYLINICILLKIHISNYYKKNILLTDNMNVNLFLTNSNINIYLLNRYIYYSNQIIYTNMNLSLFFKETNKFCFLYKEYSFIIYIWLYSIKLLHFYKINISSIPSKKSLYTVLRSPHKDKKAREQFKISKLKKSFFYPSFLNSNNNLLFQNFVNETILIKHIITISK